MGATEISQIAFADCQETDLLRRALSQGYLQLSFRARTHSADREAEYPRGEFAKDNDHIGQIGVSSTERSGFSSRMWSPRTP